MPKKTQNTISRSDFIRSHRSLPPQEIVELGEKQGLKFSTGLVYAVRSFDKQKRAKNAAKKRADAAPKTVRPAARAKIVRKTSGKLDAIATVSVGAVFEELLERQVREVVRAELRAYFAKLQQP